MTPERARSNDPIFFSIPLASKSDDEKWRLANELLSRTLKSIFNQTDPDFEVYICCHDRPHCDEMLDPRVRFIQADFPRPDNSSQFIRDKSWKRRKTMSAICQRGGGYVVLHDADDLLSNRLVKYVRETESPNGYVYRMGFAMDYVTGAVAPVPGVWTKPFSHVCGSSAILKLSPEDIGLHGGREPAYLGRFKQHSQWEAVALEHGRPLHRIPFPACIYVLNTDHNLSSTISRDQSRINEITSSIEANRVESSGLIANEFAIGIRNG